MDEADEQIASEAEQADDENTGHDFVHFDEAFGAHHHRADAVGGGDDFGDNEVGPTDGEHLAGGIDVMRECGGEDDAPEQFRTARAEGAVDFDSVTFAYPGKEPAVNGVSFRVRPGEKVAIVGRSGGGKSTLVGLVPRFYDPTGGSIRVNGHDSRTFPRDELRDQFGYVEQDAPTLAGTLADNLRLASPDASDQQCERVLRAVNLGEVLERNPLGLQAPVGEDGVMLSGGERQRLAIARALLTDAPILLLDESTSSLDGVNEQRMREAIDAVSTDRTLVVIAHRLSTVVDSDIIVVLQDGAVVGQGTHAELVESTPLYRDLARHQLLA